MTDPGDGKEAFDGPPQAPKTGDNASLQPDLIAIELQKSESDRDLKTFRTLINIKTRLENPVNSTKWNLVIVELLRIISASDDVGEEQVLLASLALVNVLFRSCPIEEFNRQLRTYWSLKEPFLEAFGNDFRIRDPEWFKLVVIHGYLQVNIETIYDRQTIALPFEVLRRNCLRYTKYSYFSYKTLQSWLEKTAKTDFWWTDDASTMENDLEAIIFSNWDSCICEIARRNSTQIFSTYLKIMSEKYDGFLGRIFVDCMENLSWQNELKYTILAEVCRIWDDLPKIVSSELPSCLFTSLTKNHLKHPGTKLYLTILDKLKANEWEEIFGVSFFRTCAIWESHGQVTAIELLWEQWMKPTIAKFPNVFEFLWTNDTLKRLNVNRSYLEKIGDRQGFQLNYEDTEYRKILNNRVIDASEPVRLNAFAILCQQKTWKIATEEADPFAAVKIFLYFNVDTSSIVMRKGIVKNFDMLFNNLVRIAAKDPDAVPHICRFLRWLHEFLLDCFELGASYQRTILAMSLYEKVLILTSPDDTRMGIWNAEKSRGESRKLIACAANLREKINGTERWLYCDLRSTRIMYSLVYNPVSEVREKAAFMLVQYFCADIFPAEEEPFRWANNDKYCKSSKIYEVAIGATVEKIRNLWDRKFEPPLYQHRLSTVLDHVSHARNQLSEMQRGLKDILHCLVNGSPVYGSLTVILEVGFLMGPVEKIYDESTIEKILHLAEDVATFFLSSLSSKAKNDKYSSSFEEMGQAIGDSIRNSEIDEDSEECILSSAHQLLISGIWMSLKVSSEIAAEIGLIAETEEIARCATDLIVSILLKCRHKGAIEAAGLALAKLTKCLSRGKYSRLIESHLTDLLSIDGKDSINLTRRGAGLSIMFYRIVSSDDRRNRPWLHLALRKLLDSLKTKTEDSSIQSEDGLVDSPRARHLHFLRFLVADKALQAQLVPYFEDVCLTCFRYLQSPQWTVRNASLQLFGAIVPRLVGQCSARELDYGIGNSVDHFVTHYPLLAETVMRELKSVTNSFAGDCGDAHVNSNVVPILTLLSKMSCGGCELADYSAKCYLTEARKAFTVLFGHPVFNVRVLAGKAYAALSPLFDIPYDLAIKFLAESMIVEGVKRRNHEHGKCCAQLYLLRKFEYESQCTFSDENHKRCKDLVKRGSHTQLEQLRRTISRWLAKKEEICYTVESALMRCLHESLVGYSGVPLPRNVIIFQVDWSRVHRAINKMHEERSKPGFIECVETLMFLSCRLGIAPGTSVFAELFHTGNSYLREHRAAVTRHLNPEPCSIEFLVDEALAIFDDPTKSDILLDAVNSIRNYNNEYITEEMELKIGELTDKLTEIEVDSRPYGLQLRISGYSIQLRFKKYSECSDDWVENSFEKIMRFLDSFVYDEDAVIKELAIDCLSRFLALRRKSLDDTVPLRKYCGDTFFVVTVGLLVDEDTEIRESIARAVQPLINGGSDESVCAKAVLHRILHKLSLSWAEKDDVLKIFLRLTSHIKFYVEPEGLHSPFQPDDTLNRDDTSMINILFYFVRSLIEERSPTGSNDSVEVQQIDGAINAKYQMQRESGVDLTHLKSVLKIDRSNYLSTKKTCLIKAIDRC